ncbi:hypothetical protein [Ectobacillus ponti]|uniref:Pilus assembly protein PilO n=1 Tax=Ectobacillus ponti TaxID=2961894 RepID=A0AA41X3X8_9BACI|nr:hypothetical protein [Ectobacillus ponti]MCP8968504.1 hypothetical protein [Ectobacillus ponti]
MSVQFSRWQQLLLLLVFLIAALAVLYLQFGIFEPMRQQQAELRQELKIYQASAARKKNSADAPAAPAERSMLLRQIPAHPLPEQYVLDLAAAEAASGVTILSAALQNAGGTASPQQSTKAAAAPAVVPLTWAIDVRYDVYEQLQAFLTGIEGLMRMSAIHGITFQGREEILAAGVKRPPYTCSVVVSAYYVSNLPNADELSTGIDRPPLCKNRTNPLKPQLCQ